MQAIAFEDLMSARLSGAAPNIVAAGALLLRQRFEALSELMRTGKIVIEVRPCSVIRLHLL